MFHRLIAFIFRKFWTHCPRCYKHFGGHQKHHHHVAAGDRTYRIVCGQCKDELCQ